MLCVFCFARRWLDSRYFAALTVFLVFFGEDFSFIPGLLLREPVDWSVEYFRAPAVFSLFFNNPMLPAVGLLFAGLFCLRNYLREPATGWLIATALLFTGLVEVKLFAGAHLMSSLGFAGIVYLAFFRRSELFKVAVLTAFLVLPLVAAAFFHNKNGADLLVEFNPWPYNPQSLEALGLKDWSSHPVAFTLGAVPLFLIGCFGLRVIGAPAIATTLFHPGRETELRFLLAFFVVMGVVIALTFRVVPQGGARTNNSIWFLAQSKYVAWIFAVEFLRNTFRRFTAKGMKPLPTAAFLTAGAVLLSAPSTVQHFTTLVRSQSITNDLGRFEPEVLGITDFLSRTARPGDVVLTGPKLLAPVLALTGCRVPIGYYANNLVPRDDFRRRSTAQKEFWRSWRKGEIRGDFLREAGVCYLAVEKGSEGVPSRLPENLSRVFENGGWAVFRVAP